LYGFIDSTGRLVVPPQFEQAFPTANGFARVQRGKKWGFINRVGKTVIELRFEDALDFSEGVAAVRDSGLMGYIDTTGKMVIEPKYPGALSFFSGRAMVLHDILGENGRGFIDHSGRLVFLASSEYQQDFSEGLSLTFVDPDMEVACVDTEGKVVFRREGNQPGYYHDGVALVEDDHDYVDREGFTTFHWQGPCEPFSEGLAAVGTGSYGAAKWGYVDKTGTMVIRAQYDEARGFSGGLAPVRIGRRWGFIDRTGKMVIEPQFDDAMAGDWKRSEHDHGPGPWPLSGFADGLAKVVLESGSLGYINRTGAVVWPAPSHAVEIDGRAGFHGGDRIRGVRRAMDVFQTMMELFAVMHSGSYPGKEVSWKADDPAGVAPCLPGGDPFAKDGKITVGKLPVNPMTGQPYVIGNDLFYEVGGNDPSPAMITRADRPDCLYREFPAPTMKAGTVRILAFMNPAGTVYKYAIIGYGEDPSIPLHEGTGTDRGTWTFYVLHN
jgi:hypothetical protein